MLQNSAIDLKQQSSEDDVAGDEADGGEATEIEESDREGSQLNSLELMAEYIRRIL